MKGKMVVVGGHSRHVGKTPMMRIIERVVPEMNWRSVKISSHRSHAGSRAPSTAAGAQPAVLLRLADEEFAEGIVGLRRMLAEGCNLLVESNRIVAHLRPDLVVFVIDPLNPDWKASSAACLHRADALVFSRQGSCPALLQSITTPLSTFFLSNWETPPVAFPEWIRTRLLSAGESWHEMPAFDFDSGGCGLWAPLTSRH